MLENIKAIQKILRTFTLSGSLVYFIQSFEDKMLKKRVIFRSRDTVLYRTRYGILLKAPAYTERWILLEVLADRVYIPSRKFEIAPEDIVVDIGAHIGTFSIYAGKRAYNGIVVAYEPLSFNFKLLMENIKLNDMQDHVFAKKKAVYGHCGQFYILLPKEKRGALAYISKEIEKAHKSYNESIEAITLDQIFEQEKIDSIDFLKMDCEGSEWSIFLNADFESLKKIRRISAEFHLRDKKEISLLKETLKKLKELQFNIKIKEHSHPDYWKIGYLYAVRE
ncbi:MAG: FkbM family methyltransferase [Thermoproteales archaeon]|nr:FkbM family methyltransferase [Thermoproteales archaeon]